MKKICVVTGTRAEYGLLSPLMTEIEKTEDFILSTVVTGMHLSPEFGLTYKEIEKDGFQIDEKIEMLLSADTPGSILKSMGIELIGFADFFGRTQIDMVVLLGDRYESFVAASAALVFGIPIAHIHGGESTEGAIDEAFRHSITKMSSLHFTATEAYRKRVIQLGEQPDTVFHVGSLGIEKMKKTRLLPRKEIESFVGMNLQKTTLMVTYHPVTTEGNTAEKQMKNLLQALDEYPDCNIIFTKANADAGGRIINRLIDEYVEQNSNRCKAFISMGQIRYWSALSYCAMAIGNSSSGIIEVPSFQIPTVNVGDRQKGRICAESVIHCGTETEQICEAVQKAFLYVGNYREKEIVNPYEGIQPVRMIMSEISKFLAGEGRMQKKFFDIDFEM